MLARLVSAGIARSRLAVGATALALVATSVLIGVALANTFTVEIAKSASVTNVLGITSRENIVVTSHARAVYELSGDRKGHPKCRKGNGCFAIWPPVTVSSRRHLSKGPGIKGRLGTWRRGGVLQVTLSGHPLYRFTGDTRKNTATGEGLHSFGGTWHVVTARPGSGTTTSTTPTSTVPSGCAYPPCP